MTTRRWMAALVVVAASLSASLQAERWTRYALAARRCRIHVKGHEEGRVTLNRAVEKSRELMETELAVCWTNPGRIAAIEAHLVRASSLIDQEINLPWVCRDHPDLRRAEIDEVRGPLLECEALLTKLTETR